MVSLSFYGMYRLRVVNFAQNVRQRLWTTSGPTIEPTENGKWNFETLKFFKTLGTFFHASNDVHDHAEPLCSKIKHTKVLYRLLMKLVFALAHPAKGRNSGAANNGHVNSKAPSARTLATCNAHAHHGQGVGGPGNESAQL